MDDPTGEDLLKALKIALADPSFQDAVDDLLEIVDNEQITLPDGDEILFEHEPIHSNVIDMIDIFMELQKANRQARPRPLHRRGKARLVVLNIHNPRQPA